MALPLHTGVRTATVASEWSVWETRCRMVLTDPWALPRARRVLEDHLLGLDQVVALRGRRSVLRRMRAAGRRDRAGALLAELLGGPPTGRIGRFPYGIAAAPPEAPVHRPPREPWEIAVDTAALAGRAGLHLDPGTAPRAWAAQLCAEAVAEATSCGVLIALGGDVATSGLAPAGGWRVALDDAAGTQTPSAVAIDGGAVCTLVTTSTGCAHGSAHLHRVVAPATERTFVPEWRSVTIAAADAVAANAACVAAIVRGRGGVEWLDRVGLPARLVTSDGEVRTAGGWPAG